jgi:hypothetical protein
MKGNQYTLKRRLFKYVVTVVEKNTSFISSRIFEIILIFKLLTSWKIINRTRGKWSG